MSLPFGGALKAVLFDLDGTLVDSAPDLAGAANDMLAARARPPLPYASLRPMAGSGARGMLGVAFGIKPADEEYELLKAEFLDRYETRLLHETLQFPGVASLLEGLAALGLPWGIVTNKAERFALPLAKGMELTTHAALVGGDTTPHTKPHPAPLLEAARRMGVAPAHCIYVGDDERDITAGRAAGMRTVTVAWGYLGLGGDVSDWGADLIVSTPQELLAVLASHHASTAV